MKILKEKDFKNIKDESMNIEFLWPIYIKNKFMEAKNVEPGVIGESGIKKIYKPLEEYPELFLKFAKLGEKYDDIDLNEVQKWVEKYGVLGKGRRIPISKGDSYKKIEGKVSNFQTLSEFRGRVFLAHKLLTLYEDVLTHDENSLRDKIKVKKYPNAKGYYYDILGENLDEILVEKFIPGVPTNLESFIHLDLSQLERLALGYVFNKTAGKLQSYGPIPNKPVINYNEKTDDYTIIPTWSFPHLWGFMLMTFYWLLVDINNKVRCKECEKFFNRQKRSKALYCPECRKDREPRKNDYYHRNKEIIRLVKKGYKLEEIQKRLPRAKKETIEKRIKENQEKN